MASHYFEKAGIQQPPTTKSKSGKVSVSTTPSTIWTPASGKRIVVKGASIMSYHASLISDAYITLNGIKIISVLVYINHGAIMTLYDGLGLDIANADDVMTLVHGNATSVTFAYNVWGYEL